MILRATNSAGTHIYPQYKSGQLEVAQADKEALTVFVPDGHLPGGDWVCTIEKEHSAVVLDTVEDLGRLITALEIAYEKAKAAGLPHKEGV